MKRVLFLTYPYPYGSYGASSACSVKIMNDLASDPNIEVHCVSYEQLHNKQPYESISGVKLHIIPNLWKSKSRFVTHLQMITRIPIYPINSFLKIFQHYKYCKQICIENKFDLVVAQYFPEHSAFVGVLLKKHGFIDKFTVIFWDNLYGKSPSRILPKKFAIRRKILAENYIAKYADSLLSLYPIKKYHDKYGDVSNAVGKRSYLGIPNVMIPSKQVPTLYTEVIEKGKLNILYSGTIINPRFISNLINVLNFSSFAENINLIFFSRGFSESEFDSMRSIFKGTIQSPGYIPIKELLTVYRLADVFVSFPGDLNSIRSKCYEYMSFGKPMILMYENSDDVNVSTFSKYPLSLCLDIKSSREEAAISFDKFISSVKGQSVDIEEVESLFPLDTPKAYVTQIKLMLN